MVVFSFSGADGINNIILELYAGGNIILTDQHWNILLLLRSHKFDEDVKYAKGEVYPFTHAANLVFREDSLTEDEVQAVVIEMCKEEAKVKGSNLKMILSKLCPYMHPQLAEHCLRAAGCTNPNKKLKQGEVDFNMVIQASSIASDLVKSVGNGPMGGYLTYKEYESGKEYIDFSPIVFIQHTSQQIEEINSFDRALDIFFSKAEEQKFQQTTEKQEKDVWKKKQRIEHDQERRIQGLKQEQIDSERSAFLIERNIEDLDALIRILQLCLETGVSWVELWRMIVEEQERGNPYAQLIYRLNLEHDMVEVKLRDEDYDIDAVVGINIFINANQNARNYYDMKKSSVAKEQKTIDAMQQAMKQAEKKAKIELQKQNLQLGTGITKMRKIYWWEKFNWFISSENYIVISGKDAQQNEIIVKRYLRKGDVYVHADIHGASSTVVKNPNGGPIPSRTLNEAGAFCVSFSSAWNNKVTAGSWWVHAEQVSKTAPTGMFLPTGSFMIRGKKNYMIPPKLELTLVLLFKLGEESISKHLNERGLKLEELKSSDSSSIVFDEELMGNTTSIVGAEEERIVESARPRVKQQPKQKLPKKNKEKIKKEQEQKQKQDTKKMPRGKARKLKMMKEKYGDQDEEERKIKLSLLGSKEIPTFHHTQHTPIPTPSPQLSKIEEVPNESTTEPKITFPPQDSSSITQDSLQPTSETSALQELTETQEIEQVLKDENLMNEEELQALTETDSLTGQPLKDDVLLFCLPMCAPASATPSYKYRIKLKPGGVKKGKAVKMATYIWLNNTETTDMEKVSIKKMSEMEIINNLPGKVTVSVPEAAKIHKDIKKLNK